MKQFLLLTVLLVLYVRPDAGAQMIKDPADWNVVVKKGTGRHYTVIYHLTLKPDWHLWAMKPGGDGLQIPTRFTSAKKGSIQAIGAVQEVSRPATMTMEGIDGKVNFYAGKADFRQDVVGARGQSFTTTVQYQSCSDKMCLPPKKALLTIVLP